MRPIALKGLRFGRLIVLAKAAHHRRTAWKCKCNCGKTTVVTTNNLRSGKTISCGCFREEMRPENGRKTSAMIKSGQINPRHIIKHGESSKPTPEYDAWHSMKGRCSNPDDNNYYRYGGRGIGVCQRWMESYEHFLADMGRRPSSAYSLDRIDNNGSYEPSNCRWATRSEQQQNKRVGILMNTNSSGVPGVSFNRQTKKWDAYHWIRNRKIGLGRFERFEDAAHARKTWEQTKGS